MIGGTVSIPNFCNGDSGNGLTSFAVRFLKYLRMIHEYKKNQVEIRVLRQELKNHEN